MMLPPVMPVLDALPLDGAEPVVNLVQYGYDLAATAYQTPTNMFQGTTLATTLTDAQSIVTLFATPIAIIVAFWGSRKLVGILRKFVR